MKDRLAHGLSVLLHPLLMPSYLVWVLCYALPAGMVTGIGLHSREVVLRTWGLTFWLPALLIAGLRQLGLISSMELPDRRQRPLPLLISTLCFVAAGFSIVPLRHGGPIADLLFGIALSVLLTLLITLVWKISAHGVGMGGAIGLFAVLLLNEQLPLAWGWLLLTLLLATAVAWARLQLRAHTPAQVLAGLALGTGVSVLVALRVWPALPFG